MAMPLTQNSGNNYHLNVIQSLNVNHDRQRNYGISFHHHFLLPSISSLLFAKSNFVLFRTREIAKVLSVCNTRKQLVMQIIYEIESFEFKVL